MTLAFSWAYERVVTNVPTKAKTFLWSAKEVTISAQT